MHISNHTLKQNRNQLFICIILKFNLHEPVELGIGAIYKTLL